MSYRKAHEPKEGTLAQGGSVEVKKRDRSSMSPTPAALSPDLHAS